MAWTHEGDAVKCARMHSGPDSAIIEYRQLRRRSVKSISESDIHTVELDPGSIQSSPVLVSSSDSN